MTEYFDLKGRRLSQNQALDARGIIKDGVIMRTRMTARDAQSRFRITDALGRCGLYLQRPGARFQRDSEEEMLNRIAKADAYQQHDDELTAAWRAPPTGFGSNGTRGSVNGEPPPGGYPYSAAAEGTACTIDGKRGRLVRQGAWLICKPIAQATDDQYEASAGEINANAETHTEAGYRAGMTLDQLRAIHRQRTEQAYRDHATYLQNAWRGDVVQT